MVAKNVMPMVGRNMTKNSIHLACFLVLMAGGIMSCGCQRNHDEQDGLTHKEKNNMHNQEQQVWQDGTEVFFILRNQQIIQAQKQVPESFYIKGLIEGGEFIPKSGVLGVGDLAKNGGRYGWLELISKQFHPMESDKKAQTPFIKGYMTEKGFVPSVRDLAQEP